MVRARCGPVVSQVKEHGSESVCIVILDDRPERADIFKIHGSIHGCTHHLQRISSQCFQLHIADMRIPGGID